MSNSGSKWIRPARRAAIYERDGHRCAYCGSPQRLTLDHVVPLARGGTHRSTNLVTACHRCNSQRKSTPMRWYLRMKRWEVRKRGLSVPQLHEQIKRQIR